MVVLAAALVGCSPVAAPDVPTAPAGSMSSTPAQPAGPTSSTAHSSGSASPGPGASGPASPVRTMTPGSPTGSTAPQTTPDTEASRAPHASDPIELPPQVGTEASGLARSGTIPDAFWTVGDATGTDAITAVDLTGTLRAEVTVDGMAADNAEAIAAAPCDGGRCLFVGDIGDNSARRDHVAVYRLPEPKAGQTSAEAQEWDYTYPDGAHNAESLIVSADEAVIVTKPDGGVKEHRIYRGPLGGGQLELVSTFRPPAPADPRQSLITGVVATDADWDGTRVLLLTYDDVISYDAPTAGADPAGFSTWPHRQLPIPELDQAEGIASLADHCGFAVASEAGPVGVASAIAAVRCS